jgi:hypothetical protein
MRAHGGLSRPERAPAADRLQLFTSHHVARWSAFVGLIVAACLMPANADTYWHLRAGQDIARSGQVSLVDRYSYTAAGQPWPDHEWLWQLLTYGVHHLGGMPLLTAMSAAMLFGAFALAESLAVGPWWVRLPLFILSVLLSGPLWAVRPAVLTLLALLAVTWLLSRDKDWLVPPIFLAWANAHGAVVLGLVVVGAAFLTAAARRERRRALRLGVVLAICGGLVLVTPLGWRLLSFIGESTERSHLNGVTEWRSGLVPAPGSVAFWIVALAISVSAARLWRKLPTFADQFLVASALSFIPLGLQAVRNIGPFAILALPAASRLLAAANSTRVAALSEWLRRTFEGDTRASDDPIQEPLPSLRRNRRNLAAITVGGALMVGWAWSRPYSGLNWTPVSPEAAAAIRGCPGQVFNEYNEGGYLIWFVPDRKVFIDGRQDPYSLPFLKRAQALAHDALVRAAVFRDYGIRCAALSPESRLVAQLRAQGWRQTHRDERWVVLAD